MDFTKPFACAAVLVLSLAASSVACDCLTLNEAESFEEATAVFTGRVIGSHSEGSETAFILKVERSFKGSEVGEVKILSFGTDCDAQFYPGVKYIVYAQKSDDGYFAGSCLRTRALAEPPDSAGPSGSGTFMSTAYLKNHRDTVVVVTVFSLAGSILLWLLVKKIRLG